MHGFVVKNTNQALYFIGIFLGCLLLGSIFTPTVAAQSSTGTTIATTICASTSTITLDVPVSDSIVTNSTVSLSGSVGQASQIQVFINDVYDGVIPLNVGQTTYSGSVQLSSGTYTIKVVAINSCAGSNGFDSAVVTYQPSTSGGSSSSGSDTTTQVGGVQVGQESLTENTTPKPKAPSPLLALLPLLEWLNLQTGDANDSEKLSPWRAAVIGAGMYILIVGVATFAVKGLASFPIISAILLPKADISRRAVWLSWILRLLGLLVVIAALVL